MSVGLGARPPEARLLVVRTVLIVECEFNPETPSCVSTGRSSVVDMQGRQYLSRRLLSEWNLGSLR